MLRVLVAEDSPTARALLVDILGSDAGMRVVGIASNGREAVEMAQQLRPDLVTMDVHMPLLDGLEATREIMALAPAPILIVSSDRRDDAALSLSATEAGALMVVPKPEGPGSPGFAAQCDYLLRMARAMAQVRVVRRWRSLDRPAPPPPLPEAERAALRPPRLVAVGASTGGPAALRQMIAGLPADFPVPLLVVQHIASGFAPGLAEWLNRSGRLHVKLAEAGEPLRPRTVYIAPDGHHLGVLPDLTAQLAGDAPIGLFRPSASYLFRSAAAAFGATATAVVLTGMGDDGVEGLHALRAAGGRVLAQDEGSSVVYGMAREAVRAGVVDEVLPLDSIADRLMDLVRERVDA